MILVFNVISLYTLCLQSVYIANNLDKRILINRQHLYKIKKIK